MDIPFLDKLLGQSRSEQSAQPAAMGLLDFIAPPAIKFGSDHYQIGEKFAKSYFIFSFPRYLSTGWLAPIINMDIPLDISVFLHPIDTGLVLKKLRKKVTEVQSEIMEKEEKGLVRDPVLETAYKDIEVLRDRLQTAQERMFHVGIYITVYGDSLKELEKIEGTLRSMLESRLVYIKPALYQQEKGMSSVYPCGIDQLQVHTTINTSPLSTVFPFVSFDLSSNEGILYGINQHNNSLVLFDRFSLENANSVIFGKSGGGKSILKDEPVLIKEGGEIKLEKIGSAVGRMIRKYGLEKIDQELEGAVNPDLQVWSFGENLKGEWSNVSVAARKEAPTTFYKFKTRSGREVVTTGDHNMLILKNGKITVTKSSEAKTGEFIPLPAKILQTGASQKQKTLNLLDLLKDLDNIYVSKAEKIIKENYQAIKRAGAGEQLDRYLYKYKKGRRIPLPYFLKILHILGIKTNDPYLKKLKIIAKNGNKRFSFGIELPVSPALTRLMGFIAAEGTVNEKFIIISNTDPEFLERAERDLGVLGIPFCRNKSGIACHSRVFVEIIKKIAKKQNSKQKRVPALVFGAGKNNIASFLSAYFEGDGGIEHNKITAVSKSKELISDICYLLYCFGITGRVRVKKKKATNAGWKKSRQYWQVSVSGKENLEKFAGEIGFISQKKNKKLLKIIKQQGNTNVGTIPGLAPLFRQMRQTCPIIFKGIPEASPIIREIYNPSPKNLNNIISKIEEKIAYIKNLEPQINSLSALPELQTIVEAGKGNKELNKLLWNKLGQSWRLMKNQTINPKFANVSKAAQIIYNTEYALEAIKEEVHTSFKALNLPIKHYNRSLQAALVERPMSNTRYSMLQQAVQFIWQEYQEIINKQVPQIESLLKRLKKLTNADLTFDEIIEIKKISNKKEKYVYDLTVDNENFLCGTAGMFVHNSFAVKLEILRYLMLGVESIIIDPENEYQFLSDAVDGKFYNISLASDSHINPFDLPEVGDDEEPKDVLRSSTINLVGLIRIMLGGLTPEEDAIVDQAITETYAARDITPETDPSLWKERVPLLADLESVLETMDGAESLVNRLRKFTKGVYAGFFNYPTNVTMDNELVVFGIKNLETELRPLAMYIIMRYIWNAIKQEMKKRILVIDEAWWLMQTDDSASFLFGIVKRGRKYWLGTTTITQDVNDFMKSEYGQPIITNSSLQLLMKQSPATIDVVKETFNLTDQEKYLLLESPIGEGIFFAGEKHVAVRVVASYTEDQIITTSPEEVKKIKQLKRTEKQ